MKFAHALTGVLLLLSFSVSAQQVPSDRLTEWSKAGLSENRPTYDSINVLNHGLLGDGTTPNDVAIKAMLAQFVEPTVFHFPAGEYYFAQPIILGNGQVLAGASAAETTFRFNLNGGDDFIQAIGETSGISVNLTETLQKNASTIQVESGGGFQAGDYVYLIDNDEELVFSTWGVGTTGQYFQITEINDNIIQLDQNVRRTYEMMNQPSITKVAPIEWAGVENLHLIREDATTSQTSSILFDLAANCWVKCVHSEMGNFGHVTIQRSSHVSVSGGRFQDAFAYGGGGQGYGVVLQTGTGDCLVENNTFDHLRHSMLLQSGANGNVVSYNHSANPYWEEVSLPTNSAGDLVLHGNYPYANLFEGNIVQNIVIDDSHGMNGPFNTFLRNRAELNGIFMNNNPASPNQNFVGNEVSSTSIFSGMYVLEGEGHFEFGNNVKGFTVPQNTELVTIQSLYLTDAPTYFAEAEMELGSIGLPNNLAEGTIPAEFRIGTIWTTDCEVEYETPPPPPPPTSVWENKEVKFIHVFPNPTDGFLKIEWPEGQAINTANIRVRSVDGKLVAQAKGVSVIDLTHLEAGLYLLEAEADGQFYRAKFMVEN